MQPSKRESKPHTLLRPLGMKLMGTARTRDNLMLVKILAIALTPLALIATTQAAYCHYTSPTLTINQCIAREVSQSESAKAKRDVRQQPAAQPRNARPQTPKGATRGR